MLVLGEELVTVERTLRVAIWGCCLVLDMLGWELGNALVNQLLLGCPRRDLLESSVEVDLLRIHVPVAEVGVRSELLDPRCMICMGCRVQTVWETQIRMRVIAQAHGRVEAEVSLRPRRLSRSRGRHLHLLCRHVPDHLGLLVRAVHHEVVCLHALRGEVVRTVPTTGHRLHHGHEMLGYVAMDHRRLLLWSHKALGNERVASWRLPDYLLRWQRLRIPLGLELGLVSLILLSILNLKHIFKFLYNSNFLKSIKSNCYQQFIITFK